MSRSLTPPHLMARRMARWVWYWWWLAMGVATASPMVRPQAMELVCSSVGMVKLVQKVDDASPRLGHHTLDCPLCMALSAPPPAPLAHTAKVAQPLRYVLPRHTPTPWVVAAAAPLPARGPPQG